MSWTKEAPTEPGYYWWRKGNAAEIKHLVEGMHGRDDLGFWSLVGPRFISVTEVGGQWWPERIQEPPQ